MTVEIEKTCFAAFALFIAAVCVAAQPFERYQTVIDRKPFGPEPVNFDPDAAPGSAAANAAAAAEGEMTEEQRTAEEQQLAASVRVSMINITPVGDVAVGFTDTSANPVENYYLKVGRSQNGWTVKSADPATESVTLEKGGVDVTVKLGETSGGGKASGAKRGRGHHPMTLQSRNGPPAATANAEEENHRPPLLGGRPLGGLANLRKRRAEEMRKAKVEAERKAEAEAVAAAEREEKAAREEEERRVQEEQKAREAEERAQQREALLQIQEQLKKERAAREAAQRREEQGQEAHGDANNVE
ncbi:MAG: hypothetical protein IKK82_13405 [Kiritimatiellae bacterium]|nr:hypothetical protein [Kiritimatiellia bacterium]